MSMLSAPVLARSSRGRGRKAVDQLAVSAKATGQQAVWEAILALQCFQCSDLSLWLCREGYRAINDSTISCYIRRLCRGGYLTIDHVQQDGMVTRHTYRLAEMQPDRVGVGYRDNSERARQLAPRVRKDGSTITGRANAGQDNLWRTLKILTSFHFRELAMAASTGEVTISPQAAKDYIRHLYQAGYLQLTQPSQPGRAARYRLLSAKNTGPKALMVQRNKQVFDTNLNQVMSTPSNRIAGR